MTTTLALPPASASARVSGSSWSAGPAGVVLSAPPRDGTTDGGTGAVVGGVRRWLRAEGLAALATAVTLYASTGRGWGFFALLFLAPDLSFAAYLAGPRVGAAVYNAVHSYVGPLAVALAAHAAGGPRVAALLPVAYLWAAHVGWDRLLGYGLKYPTAFGDTHLGRKGRGDAAAMHAR